VRISQSIAVTRLALVHTLAPANAEKQRALHPAQHVGGDMGIAGGRVELRMAQQHLNHPHVDIALQQMRRERMPQRMWGDPAAEPRCFGRHVADAVELAHLRDSGLPHYRRHALDSWSEHRGT
jgi:hypothetical protein